MNNPTSNPLVQMFVDMLPHCAITLLDADGRVTSWNAGAHAILGYSAAEAIGLHLSSFYTKDDIAAAVPAADVAAALAGGRTEEAGRRVHKDGTELAVHSILMPLYDQQRKLVGFGSLTREAAGKVRATATTSPSEPTREQILVVDDNDEVRGVAVRQLTSLGYRVIAASSGAEALEILGSEVDIDLLFTDVVMPGGINGREVVDQARRQRPDLKVLFTSGYFEGALVRSGEIGRNVEFIVKPYRKQQLADKVRAGLDGTAS